MVGSRIFPTRIFSVQLFTPPVRWFYFSSWQLPSPPTSWIRGIGKHWSLGGHPISEVDFFELLERPWRVLSAQCKRKKTPNGLFWKLCSPVKCWPLDPCPTANLQLRVLLEGGIALVSRGCVTSKRPRFFGRLRQLMGPALDFYLGRPSSPSPNFASTEPPQRCDGVNGRDRVRVDWFQPNAPYASQIYCQFTVLQTSHHAMCMPTPTKYFV